MSITEVFTCITGAATCISLVLIWLTTKANNGRKKKELTLQYTDSYDMNTENLLQKIHSTYKNGAIDIDEVKKDEDLLWTIEKYLFHMERLSVGINTNILDIYVLDRVMGQKTLEHFSALFPYIRYIRKEDYPAKYSEFETMCKKIRKIREKRFPSEKTNNGKIGVFFN